MVNKVVTVAKKHPAKLSPTFVKNVSHKGRYGDGRGGFGLSFLVKPMTNGRWSKTWSQRVRIKGEPYQPGLGSYPLVSLAMARDQARDNAIRVAQGEDIRQPERQVPTVAEAFDEAIDIRRPSWRNPRTVNMWLASKGHCKQICSMPVSDVTPSHVRKVIAPLWHEKKKIGRELRRHLSAVMQWAIDEGFRSDQPVTAQVILSLGKQKPPVNHPSLPHKELGDALAKIRDSDAWWAVKVCIIFMAFTCVRSGEARMATWDEVDWDNATWTIPAARMKNHIKHKVPLSAQAMEVLAYAWEQTGGQGAIFPPELGGSYISDGMLPKVFHELKILSVPHGLRATFSNWAGERVHIPEPVAEMVLAHKPSSAVVKAYRTSDFFERRVPVMQEWGDVIAKTMEPVVPA